MHGVGAGGFRCAYDRLDVEIGLQRQRPADAYRLARFAHMHRVPICVRIHRDHAVAEIVVGYPLRMSGAEGIQAEKMQLFAEELRKRSGLPVHLWDERLSSAQANRLLRETDMSIKRRGAVVDQMAAVLILQSWMEARDSRSP